MDNKKTISEEFNFYNNMTLDKFISLSEKELKLLKLINLSNYKKLNRLFNIMISLSSDESDSILDSDEEDDELFYF